MDFRINILTAGTDGLVVGTVSFRYIFNTFSIVYFILGNGRGREWVVPFDQYWERETRP